MQSFWKFLQIMEHSGSSNKIGLYPLSYGGIGNYTPADWVTGSADAFYYLSQDERMFKTHEGPPFSIKHIDSEDSVVDHKGHNMPGNESPHKGHKIDGDEVTPKYKMPPGDVVAPTSWVKLVTNPQLLDPKKY